jgi:hypothetical protein
MSRVPRILYLTVLGLALGGGTNLLFHVDQTSRDSQKSSPSALLESNPDRSLEDRKTTFALERITTTPISQASQEVTLTEVLEAEDAARIAKLAIWLPSATSAETAAMFDRVNDETDRPNKALQLELILQHWVTIDREAAFHAGRQSTLGEWACYQTWARLDPDAAWKDASNRNQILQSYVLKGMAESHPVRAKELMETTTGDQRSVELAGIIAGGLALTQPAEAADIMIAHGATPVTALKLWFQNEPEAAQAWALSQKSAQIKTAALKQLVSEWQTIHPDKIPALLTTLPEGLTKWTVQATYAQGLAASDPNAALSYTATVASPIARAGILQETAYHLAKNNNQQGALLLLQNLDWTDASDAWKNPTIVAGETQDSPEKPSRALETLKLMADKNLGEAMHFTETLSDGPLKKQAINAVVSGWPKSSNTELSEWLLQQSDPALRETGTRRLVDNLISDLKPDFDAAARWAATLPMEETPNGSTLNHIFTQWKMSDPKAAEATLTELQVPPAFREFLSQPVNH